MKSLRDLLEQCRVDGQYHTHVSMVQPLGKFCVDKHNQNNFWDLYNTSLSESPDKHIYGIAEKPTAYLPILVDIDLKVKVTEENDMDCLYTKFNIVQIVRDYQETIKKVLLKPEPKHMICFVFEKPSYICNYGEIEYRKNGVHLIFINTILSRAEHEAQIIPRVKKLLSNENIFKHLGYSDSGDVIDGSYVKNPWLLYGSRKSENMEPYKLSYILDDDREEITLEKALKDYKLYDQDENLMNIDGNLLFNLPRILSIVSWGRDVCELKPDLPVMIKIISRVKDRKKEYKVQNLSTNLEKGKKLLTIISDERASIFSDWMQIGWALYNISDGSEAGLGLWLDFSARCQEKFDEDTCVSTWEKMERRNMTIGTLSYFAREDDPIAYGRFTDEYTSEYIKQTLLGSAGHNDLAQICFEKFGTEFVCSSIVNNAWYQFEHNRWRKIQEGIYLRKKLSDDLVKLFNAKEREIFLKMGQCSNEGEKGMYQNNLKALQKQISNLKNCTHKNNIMKEAKEVFYNEHFDKLLNKNAWLIGFRNGVYDLKTNTFRPGVPEDYLSKQMPMDYADFEEGNQSVKDIYDFFEKIFPDKTLRDYFMTISSEAFVGGNFRKHVYFWSGEGDNGKSIMQLFFEKMFGPEYAIKLPTSLISGKRTQSSGASPEIIRCGNGVRWAVLQEPDKKDVLNIGIFKELSGNDTIYGRDLFKGSEDAGEIELMIKLVVICNDPPIIEYSDKATWNRIRVIPFESTFCDDAPETIEEQVLQKRFPNDRDFKDKIPGLVKPFMWVLLNHRKNNPKFVEPNKVKCATELYRKKNDIYRQFTDERIVDDPKSKICLADLHNNFKEWYMESIGKDVPKKSDFRDCITKMWGEPGKGLIWVGKKALSLAEEVDQGSVMVLENDDIELVE